MLKILQARFQQYVRQELQNVQAGFRKGRGLRYQIGNLHWVIDKASEFQENFYLFDYAKAFACVHLRKLQSSSRGGSTGPSYLPPEKPVCRSGSNS